MEKLVACPLCESRSLETLKTYQYQLSDQFNQSKLPDSVGATEERLWIYLNHLAKQADALVEMSCCQNCGFLFSNPRLSQEELILKYQIIAELGKDAQRHKKTPPKFINQRKERIRQWILPLIQDELPAQWSILDYGGAEGYLLTPYLDQGHAAYLCDYMPYELADDRIVYLGRDMNAIPDDLQFDLIFCLHTLEHVADPIELTTALTEQLTDEGYLYIEVPLGAWMEWNDVREPVTHVNYFSEQSLTYVLQQAGLQVVAIQSKWQYVTHAKHLCINILGKKIKRDDKSSEPLIEPLSTKQQRQIWRYLAGGLAVNFRYYLKQFLKGIRT